MKVIKMNYVLGLTTAILIGNFSRAQQDLEWARKISGPAYERAHFIASDKKGHIYAGGTFDKSISFEDGTGIPAVSSSGLGDLFITCYDKQGQVLWNKSCGGAGMDAVRALAVDANDHLLVAGTIEGVVDLDPGPSVSMNGTKDQHSVFVARFDHNGSLLWSRSISSAEYITCNSIKSDEEGNVYYAGSFRTGVDFDPGTGVQERFPAGIMRDMYISKLDRDGNFLWCATFAALCNDEGHSLVVDPSGIYVSGSFYGLEAVDLDPGVSQHLVNPQSTEDIFLLKLGHSGEFQWAQHLKGSFYSGKSVLAADVTEGIFIAGNFHGSVDLDPGPSSFVLTSQGTAPDAFIAGFDHAGQFRWARQVGGTSAEEINALTVSNESELICTGLFSGLMNIETSSGSIAFASSGNYDVFILRLTAGGDFLCGGSMGGNENDRASNLFSDGSDLYLSGIFSPEADLDPGASSFPASPDGQGAVYLCKIGACGIMTALQEDVSDNSPLIFPNPGTGIFNFSSAEGFLYVKVMNMMGVQVLEMDIKAGINELDLTGLPKGMYLVGFYNNTGQQPRTKKILLQ